MQKWSSFHDDWLELGTIRECNAVQHNKWVTDTYQLPPDGDVVLYVNVTAKSLVRCSFRLPGQWSVPIEPIEISVGSYRLDLATGGLPHVFIKSNCFNCCTYVTLEGEDITDVTYMVADMKADCRYNIVSNVDSLEIDTHAGLRNILRTIY